MDRFIAEIIAENDLAGMYLKSNMDRFIVSKQQTRKFLLLYLKSNMDRFIVLKYNTDLHNVTAFKIQYG